MTALATEHSALNSNVLVLNKHYAAVRVISARRAFCLLFKRIAEIVSVRDRSWESHDFDSWRELSAYRAKYEREHHDWVRCVKFELAVPRIVRLLVYDRLPRREVIRFAVMFGRAVQMADHGRDPFDRNEVLAFFAEESQGRNHRDVGRGATNHLANQRMCEFQGNVEPVKGRRVPGPRIADDDGGPVNGWPVEEARLADHRFGLELAALVVVAEVLAHVQVTFVDRAAAGSANVRGRNVMVLADAYPPAQLEHVPSSLDIRPPGLSLAAGPAKRQVRRVVDHADTVLGNPLQAAGVQSQVGFMEIPFQNYRAKQPRTVFALPAGEDGLDSLSSGTRLARTH